MATQQNGAGVVAGNKAESSEIMEVDMTAKPIDEDDMDAIIEEGDADLIEMDDGEDNMEKYIEEDMEGATMNYDDLVVEDDGESLSNGGTVSTTTREVDERAEEAANGVASEQQAAAESNGVSGKDAAEVDDRPVSIPSDSDGEDGGAPPPATATSAPVPAKQQNGTHDSDEVHEILSDKEDCVLVDDDVPTKASASSRKVMRREGSDDDIQEIVDGPMKINSSTTIQPVSKKMKMSSSSVLSQNHLAGLPADLSITAGTTTVTKDGGKFTYVDPKSLMNNAKTVGDMTNLLAGGGLTISQVTPGSNSSAGAASPASASSMRATITPVNNSGKSSGSDKNNSAAAAVAAAAAGMGNILLPALTDDMFVLEAPSFIVPYIYEKPPADNLKQIVDAMKKELDALKVKDGKGEEEKEEDEAVTEISDKEPDDEEEKRDSEKAEKAGKKSKKGKGGKSADDSWGESDESTDDEASDSETRTKVLIKDVDQKNIDMLLSSSKKATAVDGKPVAGSDNYFESPLGQFFMGIGMNMVQEHVQGDLLRMQKRKQQREGGKPNVHLQTAINNLMNNLEASRRDNKPFKFPPKRCDFCNFKTESGLSMANHYEKPHLKGNVYKCNFCEFEARPAHDILYHMEAVHNMKSKLEKPLSYHQCPNCPFEDNGKSKLARHALACTKKFVPEANLLPAQDWDPPAKIPRVKPRHGLVGTATAYQAMAAQQQRIQAASGMLNKMNLPSNQGNAALTANAALNLLQANAALLNSNMAMNMAGGNKQFRNKGGNQAGGRNRQSGGGQNARNSQQQQLTNALLLQNNFNQLAAVAAAAKNLNSTQLLQMATQAGMLPNAGLTIQQSNVGGGGGGGNKSSKNSQQPSISITPLPRQNSALGGSSSGMGNSRAGADGIPANLPKPGQHPSGNKSAFVICEICDGYIKDLDQLRSHMQEIHKVKIHPKMIYNRPPLNCQKCQYRFFTDQGLERHLLGSHGLVTSSMQEAANNGQDSGRCPICGRVYQWKLLNHVSRDHNMTLKPAHLSYKCTVCTATFGMYKQFENHVYSAHSTVAKKSGDKKSSSSGGGGGSSGGSSKGGDALLKPLKINDEITIIPQPPSKMSKTQTIEIE